MKGNKIQLYALPEKDHPILNYKNRGTLVASGAALENMSVAASHFGYKAKITILPEKSNPNFVAAVELEEDSSSENDLYSFIESRTTNRKPFFKNPLTEEQRKELFELNPVEILKVEEDKEKMEILGRAISVNEIVMFENKILHKLFFNDLVWTEREEKIKKTGLYLKTMELKPPQQLALRLFKFWPIMNFLNKKLGLARSIAKENGKGYSSASCIGAIIVNDNDEDFIRAGMLMQRIWLRATKLGLNFHLMTAVPFFWQKIMAGETKDFSKEHVELVKKAYTDMASIFNPREGEIIGLVFRIGKGEKPSAMTSRLEPMVEFL